MTRDDSRWILFIHATAFVAMACLIWLNEMLDLPHVLLGAPPAASGLRYQEAAVESGIALLIGVAVLVVEVRLARRVQYLESLLVLCAWCGRVRIESGEWVSVEHFLEDYRVDTTHGMCPECAAKMIAES